MADLNSRFVIIQRITMLLFVAFITCISFMLGLDEVTTSHVCMSISAVLITIGFREWTKMPHVPPRNQLPEGQGLVSAGYNQNWITAKGINEHYGDGLKWYLFAFAFGFAGFGAITVVLVTYCQDELNMGSAELGIVIFLVLLFGIP